MEAPSNIRLFFILFVRGCGKQTVIIIIYSGYPLFIGVLQKLCTIQCDTTIVELSRRL